MAPQGKRKPPWAPPSTDFQGRRTSVCLCRKRRGRVPTPARIRQGRAHHPARRGGVYPRPQSAEPRTPPGAKGRAATRAAPTGRLTLLRHCRGGVYPRPQSAEPRTPPGAKGRAATRAAPTGRLTLLRHCRGGVYPRPQSAEPRTPPGSKGRAATRAAPTGRLTPSGIVGAGFIPAR